MFWLVVKHLDITTGAIVRITSQATHEMYKFFFSFSVTPVPVGMSFSFESSYLNASDEGKFATGYQSLEFYISLQIFVIIFKGFIIFLITLLL